MIMQFHGYLSVVKKLKSFGYQRDPVIPRKIMKVFWRNPDIDAEDLAKACKGYEESIIKNIITWQKEIIMKF